MKSDGGISKRIDDMDRAVGSAFKKVRNELDDHRDSINQNTAELTHAYQYIAFLEQKIDKLNERLDELTPRQMTTATTIYDDFSAELSVREQEVFVVLYTSNQGLSIDEIAKYLGLADSFVQMYLQKIISKGVPVKEFSSSEQTKYVLDKTFKNAQARKNIVPIEDNVLSQLGEVQF
ncbi:MAG: helix-turn-helix domain-containing protein [Nanobdellota archaeon]